VVITCSRVDARHRVSVTDTGPGLTPEQLERLFVPFERLGAETSGVEGTGLGLALCHRIATALGGELGVHSTIGEGSTFWIELPAFNGPAMEDEPPPEHPLPLNLGGSAVQRKVLYVEDQDLNLRLVERILANRPGYQLVPVMKGAEAIELAREHQPDIILLDLNLPDVGGDEILRRLKADNNLARIPVIMVSADAMGDRIEELLAMGADGYLTKPYKLREFFNVIESALPAS
jgi:CheY-like chemotaxis protein